MAPVAHALDANANKSWKQKNAERKELKRKHRQEKLLKTLKQNKEDVAVASEIVAEPAKANPSTISIAVPGSILENAQSAELRSYVAGQIARAACIFRVHEIIVFDDVGIATARETKCNYDVDAADNEGTVRSSSLQLARILQYLECPQYLRKFFFPLHKDLKYCGLLNPLDAPHHLRQQNVFPYREGIVSEKKAKNDQSYINVGLLQDVLVNKAITQGVRVTVKLQNVNDNAKKLRGTIVSPEEPRRETGVYWGYNVRIAHSLADIFTKCPYEAGYDITIGTSDRGRSVHEVPANSLAFKHALLVFGGLKGLEEALSNDEKLNVDDPALLFDHYLNVLPQQGSRTIRTEEALLIALAALQDKLKPEFEEVITQEIRNALPSSADTGYMSHGANVTLSGITTSVVQKKQKKRKHLLHDEQEQQHEQDELATASVVEEEPPQQQQLKRSKNANNPFKPTKAVSLTNDDDFEVVASQKTFESKKVNKNIDLSRFD